MTEPVESTDGGEMIEPMSVDSIDQKELAEQLLEQAKEQNIALVGPDGLLDQLTKRVLETVLAWVLGAKLVGGQRPTDSGGC